MLNRGFCLKSLKIDQKEDLSVVLKENANKGYNKKSPQGLLICNGYIF